MWILCLKYELTLSSQIWQRNYFFWRFCFCFCFCLETNFYRLFTFFWSYLYYDRSHHQYFQMARPTIFPLKKDNNGAQLISRLNQLISITESLTTLTSVQRQELVKLFRMTIDMIILRTNQLSTEFINKCTRLVNSYQNLIRTFFIWSR